MSLVSHSERSQFENDGYLIVRNIFTPDQLKPLVAAADRYFDNCFLKKGTHGRTNLHDPALDGLYEPSLFNCIATDRILALSKELNRCEFRSTYYDLNMETPGKDNSMFWHKDSQFLPKVLPENFDLKKWRMAIPFSQIQWNVALVDDPCLQIVPGSHRRDLTDAETAAMTGKIYNPAMPGKLSVDLKAGDGVVYHSNLLHGVENPNAHPRRTIHWYWVNRGQCDPFLPKNKPLPPSLLAHLHPAIVALTVGE
jgi:ectoine hydroxylase-related dioxygenase (phytanoyl-CoA dioxygenase family)